jgi:RNA polymerase sigma-70 factor (ECF subfamily)
VSTLQDLPLALTVDVPGAAPAVRGDAFGAPVLRLLPDVPLDFDDAVRRLQPRLQRFAVRRLGDPHEAEEVVQEALLRAYTHREGLLSEDDLAAWTTVVTGRLIIDRLRVRGRSTTVADVPETGRVGRDTADVVVARDEARTALDALDAMPARQAAVLWAREVEGSSYDELCTRFAMTEPAVRSVLTRARKALRKEYALRGGTLPVGGLTALAPWLAGLMHAGRLRRLTSRLTAPAALATVGITALGGLVLSPFGADPAPGQGTYRPAQAVVVSSAAADRSLRGHPPVLLGSAAPRQRPSAGQATAARPPGAFWGFADRPLGGVEQLPCRQDGDPSLVPAGLPAGTPYGLGYGGSHCRPTAVVAVGPALPAADRTGYDRVALGSNDLSCRQVQPLTTTANPLVTCTQETQP